MALFPTLQQDVSRSQIWQQYCKSRVLAGSYCVRKGVSVQEFARTISTADLEEAAGLEPNWPQIYFEMTEEGHQMFEALTTIDGMPGQRSESVSWLLSAMKRMREET